MIFFLSKNEHGIYPYIISIMCIHANILYSLLHKIITLIVDDRTTKL